MRIHLKILLAVLLSLPSLLPAAVLSVTVLDPSGAVIGNATVSIRLAKGVATKSVTTDSAGMAMANDLAPGEYRITVDKAGFVRSEQTVALTNTTPQKLTVALTISAQETSVYVGGKISPLANSDPVYQALRNAQLTEGVEVENLVLTRDAGTFTFRSGTFSFATRAMGKTVYAVFSGDAAFHLQPSVVAEANYMKMVSGAAEVDEQFSSAVFCFTDATAEEIRAAARPATVPAAAAQAWREFRDQSRNRNDQPRSTLEALLGHDDMENVDADILTDLYTPGRTTFLAYIHGHKYEDLRFIVNQSGAIPALRSPEEVALINYAPGGEREGIWYMSHLVGEFRNHSASSNEDRHRVKALSFRIDTAIGGNGHLAATTAVRLRALGDGARVIKFDLLPSLRVSSVRTGNTEIPFIQEARKHDGSFYVILPDGLRAGAETELSVAYTGDKVVSDAGGGNFAVGARESWYPSLNSFADRAIYDLTFRVPKSYVLVSVGNLESTRTEQDFSVTHWVSETPLPVAGFNYGDFRKFAKMDNTSHYLLEAYATHSLPAYLQNNSRLGPISPAGMAQSTLVDAQNAIRVFQSWFGSLPYGRLAITQQPQFNFGQSWPTLVYLPVSAFMDDTQRYMLMSSAAFRFNDFVSEVTPHEVSHQWWGHAVGWATYRDQWLSEGFATFSAGLFLQVSGRLDDYMKYWETERKRVTDKNAFGLRPGEAIPLWMGLRLNTFRTPGGYNQVTYSKGGFVLHMLRSLMWDPKTLDGDFIDMMKDYVTSSYNQDPSTENFMAIVSKHMKPQMDLAGDHRMAWFFQQWVYGTTIPKYRFEYSFQNTPDGKVRMTGTLTQSNVTDIFHAQVPIYADLDGKGYGRIGQASIAGNQSTQPFSVLFAKRPKKVAANQFNDVLAIETVNQQVN